MTAPQITITYDPPLTSDGGSVFDAKAFDTVSKFNPWGVEVNTVADWMNTTADEVLASAIAGNLSEVDLSAAAGFVIGVNTAGDALESVDIQELPQATQAEAEAGTATDVYMDPLRTKQAIDANADQLMIVREQHASGTTGTSGSGNAWTAYNINTEHYSEISGASLASGQITLPAGTYQVSGYCQAANASFGSNTARYKCRMYNVTDAATEIVGASGTVPTYGGNELVHGDNLPISGVFTITDTKIFELQAWFNGGGGGRLYITAGAGIDEIYTELSIRKIA